VRLADGDISRHACTRMGERRVGLQLLRHARWDTRQGHRRGQQEGPLGAGPSGAARHRRPDCKDGIDHASGSWWHVYDAWGGADEGTRVWFRRTKRRLEAGRKRAASRTLSIMSHFLAESLTPCTQTSPTKRRRFTAFMKTTSTSHPGLSVSVRRSGRGEAGAEARARVAHRSYWDPVNAYDAHGCNRKSTGSRNAS
jgi:hypothetical protein